MVYLWAGVVFIFLFTVPTQVPKEEKVWKDLEDSVTEPKKKEPEKRKRYKLKDVK